MITGARILRTGFVPREVKHRDTETTHLTEILTAHRRRPCRHYSFTLAVGKTCFAKYTAEQLRQEVLNVEYQYVNC